MLAHEKPDIIDVITAEGISLKKRGKYHEALCPLHEEKTPSFKVDANRQTFYCYGCSTGGDIISFIQKLKNLSFKEALSYLGISRGKFKPTKEMIYNQKKRELVREFRQWEHDFHDRISTFYRVFQKIMPSLKTMDEVEGFSWYFHRIPIWECWFEILESRDDEAKFDLYKEYLEDGECLI